MRLTFLFKDGDCIGGNCPAAYATDRGTYVVQGRTLDTEATGDLQNKADDETGVEIPLSLIDQLVDMRLRERAQA